jgi:hypothetical protein
MSGRPKSGSLTLSPRVMHPYGTVVLEAILETPISTSESISLRQMAVDGSMKPCRPRVSYKRGIGMQTDSSRYEPT